MAALAATWFVFALEARAQTSAATFPERPMRLVVPFAAGGGIDIITRVVAQQLGVIYGKPVIVENHVGSTGLNAVQFVGAQPNDGYTLLVGSPSPFSVLPALRNDLPYNNLQDFVPVTLFGVAPEALTVNPGLPVKTLPELIAYLKSSPGKVNFGNTGPGGLPHLSSELFAQLSDTKINHVPYRGTAPSVADVISGHIQGTIDALISQLAAIKQGQLRVLGTTLKQRSPALPDIPTIDEILPGYEAISWVGLFAAPGTSSDLVNKLQQDVRKVVTSSEFRDRMATLATVADGRSPQEFAAFVKDDIARWRKVGQQGQIKLQQ